MKRRTRPPAIQTVSWEQTTVPHPHSGHFVIALVFNWIDDSDHLRRKLLEAAELISQSFSSGLLLLLLLCLLSELDLKKKTKKKIQTWFKDEIKKSGCWQQLVVEKLTKHSMLSYTIRVFQAMMKKKNQKSLGTVETTADTC